MRVSRALLASPVVEEELQMPVAVSGFPGPGFPGGVVQGVVSRLVERLRDEVRRVARQNFPALLLPATALGLALASNSADQENLKAQPGWWLWLWLWPWLWLFLSRLPVVCSCPAGAHWVGVHWQLTGSVQCSVPLTSSPGQPKLGLVRAAKSGSRVQLRADPALCLSAALRTAMSAH